MDCARIATRTTARQSSTNPHDRCCVGLELSDSEDASPDESECSVSDGSMEENGDGDDFGEWRSLLTKNRSSIWDGPYDIVVIMTGANDLKSAFFPFLVCKEESKFREDAQQRGGSLTIELERILKTVRPRMNSTSSKPLVVFPGMPTTLLPIFRQAPAQWLAVPVMGIMESKKVLLAEKHQDCIFIEAPTLDRSEDFEAQRGDYWDQRIREDTLIALRDVTRKECESKCQEMQNYERQKGRYIPLHTTKETTQANVPDPPLCDRKGHKSGSKIVFADSVHPNDEGYDFWGRHLANGILQQLRC